MKKSRIPPQYPPDFTRIEYLMEWEEAEEHWFAPDLDGIADDAPSAFWHTARDGSETEITGAHRNQPPSSEKPKKAAKKKWLFSRLIDRFCSSNNIEGANL